MVVLYVLSTNARGVLEWALERAGGNGKVLFFPDQHLGRNTALGMGFEERDMAVWTPGELWDEDSIQSLRLFYGMDIAQCIRGSL